MSEVYFSSIKSDSAVSPLLKIKRLMHKCGAKDIYSKNDIVGIKLHFGELGNTAFIRPVFIRPIVEVLESFNTKPFMTDTNTLYIGMRSNSVDHLHNANLNGFGHSTLQTPIIIADGLRGESYKEVDIPNGELLKTANLATEILNADALVVVSHFKGHELTGFGGAIKNISMGCASRSGKLVMHSSTKPSVNEGICTACGRCVKSCQVNAIAIETKAKISQKCTGCCRCVGICPEDAIKVDINNDGVFVQQTMAEYACALHNAIAKPIIYINLLTDIVPKCDCMPGNDAPLTGDIGFLASTDPVAIDRASYDLVLKNCGGKDPFLADGTAQLEHARKIGFGNNEYEFIVID